MKKSQYQIDKNILFQYLDSKNSKTISASKSKDFKRMATYENEDGSLYTYLQTNRVKTSPLHEIISIKPMGQVHQMIHNVLVAKKGVRKEEIKLYKSWTKETVFLETLTVKGEFYDIGFTQTIQSGTSYYFREHLEG
jgi:hypothetical protein